MSNKWIFGAIILLVTGSGGLWLNAKRVSNGQHSSHGSAAIHSSPLEQGGQAAFAAIIELVAMLEKKPQTDWQKIDIDNLRTHLVDMHRLMLETDATTSIIGDRQVRFDIRGNHSSIGSIHRMVSAHSQVIGESRGWVMDLELDDTGATVAVTVGDSATLNKLSALGFYGFMSLDSHHQVHHYQMALGMSH